MAGGSGSRLWPLSRKQFPKQFLTLTGEKSMLQKTIDRLSVIPHQAPIVICNEEHRFSVAEQLRLNETEAQDIILEPVGKNTAPAITLAALKAVDSGLDPFLLVLAADHVIKDEKDFCNRILEAKNLAESGKLVTFGVMATKPETEYGYIKVGKSFGENAYNVDKFVEKPNLETAEAFLQSGDYYWNSGIFLFKASSYLSELKKYNSDIFDICKNALTRSNKDLDFVRINKSDFASCPDISVDHALMEKTRKALVVPLNCGWSDIGSWSSLWDFSKKDANGSVLEGDVLAVDSKNNFVFGRDRLIATVGVEDLAVVDTKDALLVAKKSEVRKVKDIVSKLTENERSEYQHHREVYRPWGKYDLVDIGERFQVKRITVNPQAKISVQLHNHRAEHWIVVSGTAKVLNGSKEILLTENQSTYIPIGVVHSLENPTSEPLELIEVQSGSYLGEDDIVRFEDRYLRLDD